MVEYGSEAIVELTFRASPPLSSKQYANAARYLDFVVADLTQLYIYGELGPDWPPVPARPNVPRPVVASTSMRSPWWVELAHWGAYVLPGTGVAGFCAWVLKNPGNARALPDAIDAWEQGWDDLRRNRRRRQLSRAVAPPRRARTPGVADTEGHEASHSEFFVAVDRVSRSLPQDVVPEAEIRAQIMPTDERLEQAPDGPRQAMERFYDDYGRLAKQVGFPEVVFLEGTPAGPDAVMRPAPLPDPADGEPAS